MSTHPHVRDEQLRSARRHALAVCAAIVLLLTLPAACDAGLLNDTPDTSAVRP